jgi:hypothetical protein
MERGWERMEVEHMELTEMKGGIRRAEWNWQEDVFEGHGI